MILTSDEVEGHVPTSARLPSSNSNFPTYGSIIHDMYMQVAAGARLYWDKVAKNTVRIQTVKVRGMWGKYRSTSCSCRVH